MLKEAEAVTVRSLESLLMFVSDSRDNQSRVDAALQSLISLRPLSVENFHGFMENLEMCIEDVEVGVEHLSRQLIRTKISPLNIQPLEKKPKCWMWTSKFNFCPTIVAGCD